MFEFYMKQQWNARNIHLLIKDQHGNPHFILKGRRGHKNDTLALYHYKQAQSIAKIQQSSWKAEFDLYDHQEKIATVKPLFAFTVPVYFVDHLHWFILGNHQKQTYTVYHLHEKIMTVSTVLLSSGNGYFVQINEQENIPFCLCIAAILSSLYAKPQLDEYNKKQRTQRHLGYAFSTRCK